MACVELLPDELFVSEERVLDASLAMVSSFLLPLPATDSPYSTDNSVASFRPSVSGLGNGGPF